METLTILIAGFVVFGGAIWLGVQVWAAFALMGWGVGKLGQHMQARGRRYG